MLQILEQTQDLEMQEYWTTAQAANILGKSERTIRRLLQTGVLEGRKYAGPNGMIWRVKPSQNITCCVSQDLISNLSAENQAKEEQIEVLNQKIETLDDRLSKLSAQYEKALQELGEAEKRTAKITESIKQPQNQASWWNVFKLSGVLKPVNASELV